MQMMPYPIYVNNNDSSSAVYDLAKMKMNFEYMKQFNSPENRLFELFYEIIKNNQKIKDADLLALFVQLYTRDNSRAAQMMRFISENYDKLPPEVSSAMINKVMAAADVDANADHLADAYSNVWKTALKTGYNSINPPSSRSQANRGIFTGGPGGFPLGRASGSFGSKSRKRTGRKSARKAGRKSGKRSGHKSSRK
jgi:hypothetical protein